MLVAVDGGSGGAVALDQVEALCAELREDGHAVVRAHTAEDALALTQSRPTWRRRWCPGTSTRPSRCCGR
ncbi:hypothetical protein GCM10010492_18220 [Saccharothrix mutabilis subsp. mutabilis]|uniref:Uncharacterized protein n=1 Tax=Saccharothrix mutabilis subsp. mutabilis TaxID=66855 RepID=A0ABN0TFR0_9PSEU